MCRRRVVRKGVGRMGSVASQRMACCHWVACVGESVGNVEAIMSVLQVSRYGSWQVLLCWWRCVARRYRNFGVLHVRQWWRLYAVRNWGGRLLRLAFGGSYVDGCVWLWGCRWGR